MGKMKQLGSTALLLLLFSIAFVNTAPAVSEIHIKDMTGGSTNPADGIGPAKPLMIEVVLIVIGFFAFTCLGRQINKFKYYNNLYII